MKRLLAGGLAGLVATSPMTTFMLILYLRLPWHERFTWPPFKITMRLRRVLGLRRPRGLVDRLQFALAAHFGFGMAAGSLYGLLAGMNPLPPTISGTLYGIAVWAASYLGWLPLVNLYQPPTRQSPRREALMMASHMVWGAILGLLFEGLHGRFASPEQAQTGEHTYPVEAASGERG